MSIEYNFIVQTNKYAGNFERKMCAYMTGHYGDCMVGQEIADIAKNEILAKYGQDVSDEFDNMVLSGFEDEGCSRPVEITRMPNDSSFNSFAIFLDVLPSSQAIAIMKERANEFVYGKFDLHLYDQCDHCTEIKVDKDMKILGFYIKKIVTTDSFTEV